MGRSKKEVLSLIPGLENAEIIRYGVMHRNTFINSPNLLLPTYQYKQREDLFFAGQMTGVEGYVESAASGLLAGVNAARMVKEQELISLPPETAMGSMAHYITSTNAKNISADECKLRTVPAAGNKKIKKKLERYEAYAQRALGIIQNFVNI
ncbi:hypothetical protein GCM10020331_047980 [Ectobacillus funiculus]